MRKKKCEELKEKSQVTGICIKTVKNAASTHGISVALKFKSAKTHLKMNLSKIEIASPLTFIQQKMYKSLFIIHKKQASLHDSKLDEKKNYGKIYKDLDYMPKMAALQTITMTFKGSVEGWSQSKVELNFFINQK